MIPVVGELKGIGQAVTGCDMVTGQSLGNWRWLGLLGIDLKRVFTGTFAFGAALAGLAGVVVGPYLGVYPGMDESILVLVLVVVVVGGLGSIEGAILGSLLIGLAYAIGPLVLGGFEAASIFAVMAIVLLVRPQGLLGRRQ